MKKLIKKMHNILLILISIIFPLISHASIISFPTKIDTLQERINLQVVLNRVLTPSPNLVVDGVIGRKSIQAIQSFQESRGLVPDGKVGPITRTALEVSQTGTTTTNTNTGTSTINTVSNNNTSTTSTTSGCISGGIYNIYTGKLCASISSNQGCTSSTKYSPVTGLLCKQEQTPTTTNDKYCTGSAYNNCSVTNGTGIQSRTCSNGYWTSFGACTVSTCNSGYQKSGNTCMPTTCSGSSTQSCTIGNGTGIQSRTCTNSTWSTYGSCTVSTCNSGYTQSGNTCVVNTPTCTPESTTTTCSDKCGTQTNNCGASVSCGECTTTTSTSNVDLGDKVVVFADNFENLSDMSSDTLMDKWQITTANYTEESNSIVNAGGIYNKVWQGIFHGGRYMGGNDDGYAFSIPLDKGYDELWLDYDIYADPNFDSVSTAGKYSCLLYTSDAADE
jgi:hypothetical protein